ncbi:MAG: hypothetical protein ACPL1H_00800, partial [bacterium]
PHKFPFGKRGGCEADGVFNSVIVSWSAKQFLCMLIDYFVASSRNDTSVPVIAPSKAGTQRSWAGQSLSK